MNQNISSYTNTHNESKNLPMKAYFLNKYGNLKEPSSLININDNRIDNIESNQSSKINNIFMPEKYPQQHQKNIFPISGSNEKVELNNNNLMYLNNNTNKQSCGNFAPNELSKNFNTTKMNSSSKLNFSGSNSSILNSDDEDDFNDIVNNSNIFDTDRKREEKRRISHTAAEQKRRNAIKQGYELIQNVVPSCQQTDPIISMRITRAITLEQTIDYIHEMEKEKDNHDQELDSLKKEIMALKIMKSNYEEILQMHRNQPKDNSVEINDDAIFDLFVKFSDNLFQSFQSMIGTSSFAEITSSTLNWLEQMCTTNNLKNLVLLSIYQVIK